MVANMKSYGSKNGRSNVLLIVLIVSVAANLFLSCSASFSLSSVEEKVELSVYYEALCPSCEDFIVNYLYKIFENGLISIVDLKLSPYGNAKIRSNGTIVCQHGEWECLLNTVEACAIHAWPDVSDHFPFVYCVEKLNYEDKYSEWETCFEKLNLDPKPVTKCYSSDVGHKLELQYGDEIKALEPAHAYVPWIVVDGQPLYDEYTDFMSFICKAYKGSNVPQACPSLSNPIGTPKDTSKPFNNVCYKKEENEKSTLSKIMSSIAASWMRHVGMAEYM